MTRFLDYFALISALALPIGWFLGFFLSEPETRDALRIAVYAVLAVTTIALAYGHAVMVAGFSVRTQEDLEASPDEAGEGPPGEIRSPRSGAPAFLVAFTYSKIAQSFAYSAVLVLVIARIYDFDVRVLEQVAYAMIGAAATASVLSAAWPSEPPASSALTIRSAPGPGRFCERATLWKNILRKGILRKQKRS